MIRFTLITVFGAALFALAPAAVEAHHSAVMFDDAKEVTVEGVVKEFQYTNPHSWLLVDVANKDGSVTTWGFEAEGPTTLLRNGVRPADLKFGTKLKMGMYARGRMSNAARILIIMRAVRFDPLNSSSSTTFAFRSERCLSWRVHSAALPLSRTSVAPARSNSSRAARGIRTATIRSSAHGCILLTMDCMAGSSGQTAATEVPCTTYGSTSSSL